MKRKIKILYVIAEISSYASAGGLGEVGRSFPKALVQTKGIKVQRVMPLYKCIDKKLQYLDDFPVPMEHGYETCILKTDPGEKNIPTYFLGNDRYYYRDNIYAYDDDGFRFFFFCRAVVEMLKRIPCLPDIVHTNDWHTGFLSLLIKKEFPNIKTVYTIHNISYHGFIPSSYLAGILKPEDEVLLGYPQWLNFMKAGIKYADLVTTVSAGYKAEIEQLENSFGMYEIIKQRTDSIIGILNGIETDNYDPRQEGVLIYPYDENNLEIKKKNRTLLRSEYGLPDTTIPLIAMITRLEYTKGIDLLIKAISYADLSKYQLIILGSGNAYYQGMFESMAEGYQGKIVFEFHYSEALAKKIYAAADIYLMPSKYEPCGLGQLYAMRYGAVPVVNPVGGLKDTVTDDPKHPANSTGFYMDEWTGRALIRAINRAVKAYYSPEWEKMVRNAMNYNADWSKSVLQYKMYYEKLLNEQKTKIK